VLALFYADQFDGQRMKDLTIVDRFQESLSQIVVAKSASWNSGQKVWDFFDGTIYLVAPNSSFRNIVRFEHRQLHLPRTPLDLASNSLKYGEMNIAQAQKYLELVRLTGDDKKFAESRSTYNQNCLSVCLCRLWFGWRSFGNQTTARRSRD
jgi:lipopolysaccharide export system permease protein